MFGSSQTTINQLSSFSLSNFPFLPLFVQITTKKKTKSEAPMVATRRTKGLQLDASTNIGLDCGKTVKKTSKSHTVKICRGTNPLAMRDAYCGGSSDEKLKTTILGVGAGGNSECETRVTGAVDWQLFRLKQEHVARVVHDKIKVARFMPCAGARIIIVGTRSGKIGFWNIDNAAAEVVGDGIYRYHPHPGEVSAITVQPFALSKIYTSCYKGIISLMDVEKELFDLVCRYDYSIDSMTHQESDANSLYFGLGNGVFNIWDKRENKLSTSLKLHGDRINSLSFKCQNTNIVATSSSDGTACIWDLRQIKAKDPISLKTVNHQKAVFSAYFSPSGTFLATTSYDDRVGLASGANFEDVNMINHNNRTGWASKFRAIWGWDDSRLFIGNMKRGVDVISTAQRSVVATLQSKYMSAIPCCFDAHPYNIGMLAGATIGGQVYVWTTI